MADFVSEAPTLVSAPTFTFAFLYVAIVVGRRALLALRVGAGATTLERGVVSAAIGLGLLQFVPFVLGVAGLLGTVELRLALAAIALASLYDLPAIVAAAQRAWARRRPLAWWEWAWCALVAIPLVFTFFSALAPSYDPDGIAYHLTAPKRWLMLGDLQYLPTLTYTNGPMGTEMLFASALATVGDAGAKLVHFSASVIAAAGVFALGARLSTRVRVPVLGHVACLLFLFSPAGVYSVMASSYSEGTAALAIAAAGLCWLLWFDTAERAWLAGAALASGLAVTFKLTAVLLPLALALLTVLVVRLRGRRESGVAGVSARWGIGVVVLCAVPIVPWMIRSAIVVGNPVYPMLARWIPSKNFPAEVSRDFETYNRYMIWGNSAGSSLDLDQRKLLVAAVALVVALVGGLIAWRQGDPLHRRVTIVVTVTVLAQLYAAGLYMRYWTPLLAVLLVPILAVVLTLARRVDRRIWHVALLALTGVLALGEVPGWLRGDPGTLVLASVDGDRRREFASEYVPLAPLYDLANREAEARDAVLMGFYCGGFYIDGPSLCTETIDTAVRLRDWDDFAHDIERLRVRYVIVPTVVGTGEGLPPVGAGSVTAVVRDDQYEMLHRLIEERGEHLASAADQSLYRIRAAGAASG